MQVPREASVPSPRCHGRPGAVVPGEWGRAPCRGEQLSPGNLGELWPKEAAWGWGGRAGTGVGLPGPELAGAPPPYMVLGRELPWEPGCSLAPITGLQVPHGLRDLWAAFCPPSNNVK